MAAVPTGLLSVMTQGARHSPERKFCIVNANWRGAARVNLQHIGDVQTCTERIAATIRSAEGWLELGEIAEALRELERIPSSACDLSVLRLRHAAFVMNEQWQMALLVAEVAVQLYQRTAEPWLWRAEAIRATTHSAARARDALLPALNLFPDDKVVAKVLDEYQSETDAPGAGC